LARDTHARRGGGVRPWRDVVVFVPALGSLVVGVWVAVDNVTLELSFTPVLQILFWFDGAMLAAGVAWLGWAAIVMTVSAVWNAFRTQPLRVVAVPRRLEAPKTPLWTVPNSRGGEAVEWPDLVPALVLSVLGWALSIAGIVRGAWLGIGATIVMLLLCTLLVVLGSMLLAWVVWWLRLAAHKIRFAFVPADADASELCAGRGRVTGVAHAGERELIAPLSGKPCIAFRIVGQMAGVEIDDALAAPMFLESEQGGVALRAQRWLVALPVKARTSSFDEEARTRLRRFIVSRGLRFDPDLEIGEAILDDGDRIEAWGALAMSTVPTYRDRQETFELTDDDGRPVVLQPR
jgi:hypothetical protein